jgi:hypothetical protein
MNSAHTARMIAALRTAKRVLAAERLSEFECFTIAPDRSYNQMNAGERAAIRRFDRAITKINAALKAPKIRTTRKAT